MNSCIRQFARLYSSSTNELALIKKLRASTGAPLLRVRSALREANGNEHLALTNLLKLNLNQAQKTSSRSTPNGLISISNLIPNRSILMLELRCETDFVARNSRFQSTLNTISDSIANYLQNLPNALQSYSKITRKIDEIVENSEEFEKIQGLVSEMSGILGEKLELGRGVVMKSGFVKSYVHGKVGERGESGRIGVVIGLKGGDNCDDSALNEVSRLLCMHIAASDVKTVEELNEQEFIPPIPEKLQETLKKLNRNQESGQSGAAVRVQDVLMSLNHVLQKDNHENAVAIEIDDFVKFDLNDEV